LGEPLEGEEWSAVEARGFYPDDTTLEIHGRRLSVEATHLGDNGETVVLLSDITRHHTLQDEASRKQRLVALGEMAARLAHQIRTPLSSTLLYLTLMESDLPKAQRQHICSDVRSHLQHMEALITSMLGFVKGHGKVTGPVGLEAALADAVQSCTADIESQQAAVTIKSCGPEPHLEGCHDDLVAAFSNLITNALDASPTQPNITISSRIRNNRLAVIQIADRGCGISAEAIDRIFDPFFTTRAAGNGLGLAVVAGTITQHGGTIRAANRPGGGAEFTILLPITLASETPAEVV
jgi:two-component system sensor histidine kinase FlrB